MKYIRTENGVYVFEDFTKTRGKRCLNHYGYQDKNGICILGTLADWKCYKKADTIVELCDVFIVKTKGYRGFKGELKTVDLRVACGTKEDLHNYVISQMKPNALFEYTYLGIETDKGIIYVAKMNEKGELKLI